ncbi:methionine ABC transporter ATP-binding protein [Bacillus sp. FSL W7-1360]
MISLTGVSKTFQTKSGAIEAVRNLNLTIEEGQIYGIIGYSGAGKSTLIRLLNLLERPTAGEIAVDGHVLSKLSAKQLRHARQKIGMVFQHFNLLWSRTVWENISLPLEVAGVPREQRQERVKELLRLVGLDGREDHYPSELSGGQKQRVGIARALANEPSVLLCDEATSALDPRTTDAILDLLLAINKKLKVTIVLITHEMHVIQKICDHVAVMDQGEVVEKGPVMDVFRRPQAQMTKLFVKELAKTDEEEESLWERLAEKGDGVIASLTFSANPLEETLVTDVIRRFPIEISILHGNISKLQQGSVGKLFVRFSGEEVEIEATLAYIRERGVEVEVINHA